jgi:hypothetical protein
VQQSMRFVPSGAILPQDTTEPAGMSRSVSWLMRSACAAWRAKGRVLSALRCTKTTVHP